MDSSGTPMQLASKYCRCCGANTFKPVGNWLLMPFFARHGLRVNGIIFFKGERLLRELPGFRWFKKLISRVFRTWVTIDYGTCTACNFTAPWAELSEDMLRDYYVNYLSDSYKRERAKVERAYVAIADMHGSEEELALRRGAYERYIMPVLKDTFQDRPITLLDYGGGDGGLAPQQPWIDADIFDVGDEHVRPLVQNFSRKKNSVGSYDVVQILHVLEHVGNPRAVLERAVTFLGDTGILYVEVPYEMMQQFAHVSSETFYCDEHINKFDLQSLAALISSLGMEILECEEGLIELFHRSEPAKVIRCIARRASVPNEKATAA